MAAKEEVSATQSAQGGGRGGWMDETNSGLETSVVSSVETKAYHHVVLFPHHPPPLRLPPSASFRTFLWLSFCLPVPDYRTMIALGS